MSQTYYLNGKAQELTKLPTRAEVGRWPPERLDDLKDLRVCVLRECGRLPNPRHLCLAQQRRLDAVNARIAELEKVNAALAPSLSMPVTDMAIPTVAEMTTAVVPAAMVEDDLAIPGLLLRKPAPKIPAATEEATAVTNSDEVNARAPGAAIEVITGKSVAPAAASPILRNTRSQAEWAERINGVWRKAPTCRSLSACAGLREDVGNERLSIKERWGER